MVRRRYVDPWQRAALRFGQQTALEDADDGRRLNYQALLNICQQSADRLKSLTPGRNVAVLMPASFDAALLLHCLWYNGFRTALLNQALPRQALQQLLNQCRISLVINAGASAEPEKAQPNDLSLTVFDGHHLANTLLDDAMRSGSQRNNNGSTKQSDIRFSHNRLLTMVTTSGSSGKPKVILHSLKNHLFSARGSAIVLQLNRTAGCLASLPHHHVSGLSFYFRLLRSGGRLVFTRKRAVEFIKQSNSTSISHFSLVYTQLIDLLKDPAAVKVLAAGRAVLLGGSAFAAGVLNQALKLKLPVRLSYGTTEMLAQMAISAPGINKFDDLYRLYPLPFRKVITDNGEIMAGGPCRFEALLLNGRLHRPFSYGFYRTGDSGHFEQGSLKVSGRLDSMYISGGENIHPETVEQALMSIDGVEQACVVGLPHRRWGQCGVAVVKMTDPLNQDLLRAGLVKSLSRFALPEVWLKWPEEVPFYTGVKINRLRVKEWAARQIEVMQNSDISSD